MDTFILCILFNFRYSAFADHDAIARLSNVEQSLLFNPRLQFCSTIAV